MNRRRIRDTFWSDAIAQTRYDLAYLFAEAHYDKVSEHRWADDGGSTFEAPSRVYWTGTMTVSNSSIRAVIRQ